MSFFLLIKNIILGAILYVYIGVFQILLLGLLSYLWYGGPEKLIDSLLKLISSPYPSIRLIAKYLSL